MLARAHQLHQAHPEPPARSPERERLAAAIERYKAIEDRLARIRAVNPMVKIAQARRSLEAAQEKLRDAAAGEGHVENVRVLSFDVAPGIQDFLEFLSVRLAASDYKLATNLLWGRFSPVAAVRLDADDG